MNMSKTSAQDIACHLYKYDAQAEKSGGLEEIDGIQSLRYRQQGFLAVERVLTANELQRAMEAIDDIIHKRIEGPKLQFEFEMDQSYDRPRATQATSVAEFTTSEERENALRNIYGYVKYDERLEAIAYKSELIEVVEKLLGETAVLVQDMALLKPPSGGSEKPWHQDMAYRGLAYNKPAIGVWIALEEAGIDNGCMHVIPGSHAWGGIPHYKIRDWQICDSSVPVERDVTVPLPPGGALLFHGMLYHGTPANLSSKRRRALQLHYAPASAVKISPEEYQRIYTNEMSGAEC